MVAACGQKAGVAGSEVAEAPGGARTRHGGTTGLDAPAATGAPGETAAPGVDTSAPPCSTEAGPFDR